MSYTTLVLSRLIYGALLGILVMALAWHAISAVRWHFRPRPYDWAKDGDDWGPAHGGPIPTS